MQIECTLRRVVTYKDGREEWGSKIPLEGTVYHFKPLSPDVDSEMPHVAEVTDERHIAMFKRVRSDAGDDIYFPYPPGELWPKVIVKLAAPKPKKITTGQLPIKTVIVADELGDPDAALAKDEVIEENGISAARPLVEDSDGTVFEIPSDLDELDRESLIALAAQVLGRNPHPRSSADKLREIVRSAPQA